MLSATFVVDALKVNINIFEGIQNSRKKKKKTHPENKNKRCETIIPHHYCVTGR